MWLDALRLVVGAENLLAAIDTSCETGGNLSTNAGGIGVLRYGN